jgi:hypothetical protein
MCPKTNDYQPFVALRRLEQEILEKLPEDSKQYTSHKFGANRGVNCGMTFSGGGSLSNKKSGFSGTVQGSGFIKNKPDLRRRSCQCFQTILFEAFGDLLWYKRLICLTAKINLDRGFDRTIPGLPLTGLWFNIQQTQEVVHCDRNVVGSTFVLSMYEGEGAVLVLSTTRKTYLNNIQINPPTILAGQWANHAHCNTNVFVANQSKRKSWTLYLDKRAFSTKYAYNIPNGMKE